MSDKSCADRLPEQMASRLGYIANLLKLANSYDMPAGERDQLAEEHEIDSAGLTAEDVMEAARESLYELPLGVSSYTTFRIDLSTGGPADWLEVVCSGDTPNHEPAGDGEHYEIDRVVYHFADWFDHAERTLDGDELAAAEAFAAQVVPELVG